MKQIICPSCGNSNARDFIFKVLCPTEGCKNEDAQLVRESKELEYAIPIEWTDEELETLDELFIDDDSVTFLD